MLGLVVALGAVVGAAAPPAATLGCPDQVVPPPPPAVEEVGVPAPSPLPVPDVPVGGAALGCGEITATGAPLPPVTSAAFVLADLDSGAILAASAPHARHRPASTLKVLTALVTVRDLDPDAVVEATAEDLRIDGSKAGIGPGGRYTVRDLLAGLLLNSGNDTAQALARAHGGDTAMVARMAELARELGALDTRPATPSGLDGPGIASSAYDLALLYRVAMREPLFASTIATRSVQFPGYDAEHPGFELSNSSRLLAGYPGSLGSKSGFTDAARHTLVGAAQRERAAAGGRADARRAAARAHVAAGGGAAGLGLRPARRRHPGGCAGRPGAGATHAVTGHDTVGRRRAAGGSRSQRHHRAGRDRWDGGGRGCGRGRGAPQAVGLTSRGTRSDERVQVDLDRERLGGREPAGHAGAVGIAELACQVAGEQRDRLGDIDDPVVPDPGVGVLAALVHVVGTRGPGRHDLDDEERPRTREARHPRDGPAAWPPPPRRPGRVDGRCRARRAGPAAGRCRCRG